MGMYLDVITLDSSFFYSLVSISLIGAITTIIALIKTTTASTEKFKTVFNTIDDHSKQLRDLPTLLRQEFEASREEMKQDITKYIDAVTSKK